MQAKLSLIAFACSVAMTSSASAQFAVTTSIVWDASTPLTLASDLLDKLAPGTSYVLRLSDREAWAPRLDAPFTLPGESRQALAPLLQPPFFALASFTPTQLADVGPKELERYIAAGNTFSIDRTAPRDQRRDVVGQVVRPWLSFDTSSRREWQEGGRW